MAEHLPFQHQFQQERKAHSWSQEDVAKRLGCGPKTVRRWENGSASPQPYYQQKICELFDKNPTQMGFTDISSGKTLGDTWEDWEVAPHITNFYGRNVERTTLENWIVHEHCQTVTVLGMGGVGKSALTRKVAEQIKSSFEFVFWRSLQNAPSLSHILKSCIQFVSLQQQTDLPEIIDEQISLLIHYLRAHRCLIVLDNVESILQAGQRAGQYREGYEEYSRLIQRIGEVDHKSCLLLTSREKPKEVAYLEGKISLVRSLHLPGIQQAEGRQILQDKGLVGSDAQWTTLVMLYSGNPLALKLVSEFIQEVFTGNIARFLQVEEIAFGDINDLLDQHFQRLSKQEQEIMYWLAIEREPSSPEDILQKLAGPVATPLFLDAVHSLRRRSMIEVSGPALFTLQPVILEYMTSHLVEQACKDFEDGTLGMWAKFAFMTSQAKDYVRDSQVRLILAPIAGHLLRIFGSTELEERIKSLFAHLRQEPLPQSGYIAGNSINLLVHLHYNLRGANFSDLLIREAHLRNVPLPEVNFAGTHLSASTFMNTFGSVLSVAFSPKQDNFAIGTATGDIWVYEIQEGTPVFSCHGHIDGVWSLAFSPDGKLLASSSDDESVRIWDTATGECLKKLQDEMGRVRAIAFSPDSLLLASGSDDQKIRIWNVHSGTCQAILQGHNNRVWSVAFSPAGHFLASGSTDQTIRLWQIETEQHTAEAKNGTCIRILRGHSGWVRSVAFSASGHMLASGSDDRTVRVWDIEKEEGQEKPGTCLAVLQGHTSPVWSVAFSADENLLASSSEDQTIRLWNAGKRENARETAHCIKILQGHTHGVRAIAFNLDGQTLASGGDDQTCHLWDARSGHSLKTLQGYTNRVWSLAFKANSAILASCNEDQTIRLWDTESQESRQSQRTLQALTYGIRTIAFRPDGQMLASGGEDQTVRLWNVRSGLCVATLRAHNGWIRAVAFRPDGQILASGGEDQAIYVWNVNTATYRTKLAGHTSWIRTLAFHPDGQILASGGDDQTIRLWNLETGECIETLTGHTGHIRFVAFSPDGQTLASCAEDQTVRLWNSTTRECTDILRGHTRWVRCVAFSPDGEVLASSSDDQTIRLWKKNEHQRGEHIRTLEGHTDRIRGIAFRPDGEILASSSDDGSIRLWNWQSGEAVQTLMNERPYEQMNITGVRGLTEAQKSAFRALGAFEEV